MNCKVGRIMNSAARLQGDASVKTRAEAPARAQDRSTVQLDTLLDLMVAGVFDIESELLRLPTRGCAPVALARQVAMYLAHVVCELTLTEVGRRFARDRTTVAYACREVERRRDDPNFDDAIDLLEGVVRVLGGPNCDVFGGGAEIESDRGSPSLDRG